MTYNKKLIMDFKTKVIELADLTPSEIADRTQQKQDQEAKETQEAAKRQAVKDAYLRLKQSTNQDVQDVLLILKFLYQSIED